MLLCLLLPLGAAAAEIRPVQSDGDASFTLPDLADHPRSLSDYRGKVVLVNFWATWCPPCIYEMPALLKLKQRLRDQPFEILALNVGQKKYLIRKFITMINFDLPVLMDTSKDVFSAWGVDILPTSFLIDGDGRIRYTILGDPGWDRETTLAVLDGLLSELAQPPAAGETPPDNTANNENEP